MTISCRTDLKEYALRKLGYPALQINVTPEQIEDRIDNALDRYWEHHNEGNYRDYIYHILTQEEIDNKKILLDDWVYTVIRILPVGTLDSRINLEYVAFMQSLGAQFFVIDGLASYTVAESYLSLVNDYFNRQKIVRFNHTHGYVFIHSSTTDFSEGDGIVLEVYRLSDPNEYRKTWNNSWLKEYTTALIKEQWGQNMLKYDGFQLPSGLTLNRSLNLSRCSSR